MILKLITRVPMQSILKMKTGVIIALFVLLGSCSPLKTIEGRYSVNNSWNLNNSLITGLEIPNMGKGFQLNYDFKIVDSTYYNNTNISDSPDLHKYDIPTYDFELKLNDTLTINFPCNDMIQETCWTYLGYSNNIESHLVSRCKDVCVVYLIDSYNGTGIILPSYYDEGVYPIFTYDYLLLYSSFYDETYSDFYDYRSVIDVFKIHAEVDVLLGKFEYVGSIKSKNWSIDAVKVFDTNQFVFKVYDEKVEYKYFEIELL